MQTPVNLFKQALAKGDPQIGLWLSLAHGYGAELCAGAGFDWLVIDGEHAPNELQSMLASLQAIDAAAASGAKPSHPVVRVPIGDAARIKQVLELGAMTILVPMVETAAEARVLARAMRYPPEGMRGVGSAYARSSRWGRFDDYQRAANAQVCLLVQAESTAALDQIEAICAVDGVDGVFIGPADLSASMGYLGQPAHPEVRAAIDRAIQRIRACGKAPGILTVDESLARHYLEQGAVFVAVGIDTGLLARAASTLAASFVKR